MSARWRRKPRPLPLPRSCSCLAAEAEAAAIAAQLQLLSVSKDDLSFAARTQLAAPLRHRGLSYDCTSDEEALAVRQRNSC